MMSWPLTVAAGSLLAVLLMMLAESRVSRRHEQDLRQRGAVEPPDGVYVTMRWAYPAAFVAMAAEGVASGPPAAAVTLAGALLLTAAKGLFSLLLRRRIRVENRALASIARVERGRRAA